MMMHLPVDAAIPSLHVSPRASTPARTPSTVLPLLRQRDRCTAAAQTTAAIRGSGRPLLVVSLADRERMATDRSPRRVTTLPIDSPDPFPALL
nr:hypothetical protein CFP56_63507 [Quercus suber]